MKNELKISKLAIICVLCTAVSGAYAASSVRSLGGTGTYSSASSAAAANTSSSGSTSSVRGGSVRVTPSSGVTGTSTEVEAGTTTSGRVATTPRLSIGQYLGGTTSVSGGSSLRPQTPSTGGSSGGVDPDVAAGLRQEVDQLQRDVESLRDADDSFSDQLLDKQDLLTSRDDLVEIDQSSKEIFINTDNLAEAISEKLPSTRPVEIGSDGAYIQWRYEGDAQWNNIVSLDELKGPKGDPGESVSVDEVVNAVEDELQTAVNDAVNAVVKTAVADEIKNADLVTGADLAGLATTEQLNAKADKATTLAGYGIRDAYKDTEVDALLAGKENIANKTQQITSASTQDQYPSAAAVYGAIEAATSGIATSDDIAQFQQDVANLKTTVGDETSGLVKDVNDLGASIAQKADSSAVSALEADVESVRGVANEAALGAANAISGLSTKADKTELAAKEDVANKKTTLTNSDTDYPSTSAVTSALANKADREELSNLATKDELAGKADKSELEAYATNESVDTKLENYYTISEVDDKVANVVAGDMGEALTGKEDVSNKTQTVVDDETKYPSSAAVYRELETKAFKTDLDAKADKAELAGYATTEQLDAKADKSELANYATSEDLAGYATSDQLNAKADKSELANYATTEQLGTKADKTELANYATTEQLAGKADASTVQQLQTGVDNAVAAAGVAKSTAEAAQSTANQAKTAAENAQTTADAAKSAADSANAALAGKQDKLNYVPEDSANKVVAINDGNKASSTSFPSVGAVTEWTEQRISELSTEGLPVNPDNIGPGAITEEKLSADSVSTVKIQDGAVTTDKIADGAVTEEKLSTEVQETIAGKADASSLKALAYKDTVNSAEIDDGAVTKSKLSSDVQETLDNAVTTSGAGPDKLLGTDSSGAKVWYEII